MQRLLFLILLLLPIAAHAQSTAAQSEIGYLTYTQSSTCANPPCFVGYGSIVPITASISGPLPPGTNEIGGTQLSPTLTTPSGATLTRPANTTAYAGTTTTPQLIASSTTAGSIAVPSFAIGTSGGYASIPRATLSTNATTGWGAVTLLINLWVAAPTYTNGDGGTYAVATGAASWRVQYSCTLVQYADGASCSMIPLVGNAPVLHPSSGTAIYWDIEIASSATPISGQTYTLVPEIWN